MFHASKKKRYENILIVRFSSLGDIVLTTPVLEALRANFPKARLTYFLKEDFASILENHTSRCEIITLPEQVRKDSKAYLDFVDSLSKKRFDLIVDLQANGRSYVLRNRLNIPFLKVKKHTLRRISIVKFKVGASGLPNVRDRFLNTLKRIGISGSSNTTSLMVTEEELNQVRSKFFKNNDNKPIAVIHPGAKWDLKKWGGEKFARLAEMLTDRGFTVASFEEVPYKNFICLYGTTIREMMGCIASADVFIGNDSGPLHIAEALGIPSVGIFGPTHESLGYSSDWAGMKIVGLDIKCRPCSLYGNGRCKPQNRECMDALSPDIVFDAVLGIFNWGRGNEK
ncbi:glycosyltransferase family 9 protein [bacterium]|nr:glycosyltransferase family 9 protein [bacterium]